MKIALFSDIHANIDALNPVLKDIYDRKPDAVYCLGDLVGYAPIPTLPDGCSGISQKWSCYLLKPFLEGCNGINTP